MTMYTYEIINMIKNNNGVLTQKQYMDIYNNSPQITGVYNDKENYRNFNRFVLTCSDYDGEIKFTIKA